MSILKNALAAISMTVLAVGLTSCDKSKTDSSPAVPKAAALVPITIQLHWIPDSHQLGFWVALDKGIYKKAGLDVTVRPGGLDANPIKDVLSGAADVGQVGGVEQIAVAASENLPVKAIASIHRDTPHALISLSSKPIKSPSDFKGKTIAVAYGDTAELLLKSYMSQVHINDSDVKLVPFKYDLTPLIAGQVDAITGFATGQPATLEKMGKTPVVLSYASAGVSSYGYTLVASNAALLKKSKNISAFLKASREGWAYSFAHPEESVAVMKKRFGDAIDESLALRELTLIKALMVNNDGQLATWKLEDSRITSVLGFLKARGQLKEPVAAASVYDNSLTE